MMEVISLSEFWDSELQDPSGIRKEKPRFTGKTMVIDKGMGIRSFEDLLETASAYIDMIKIGFGTSPLYPVELLQRKIQLASNHQIDILPGGTFLEVAVGKNKVDAYFSKVLELGFTAIEVSDGTLEISRSLRNRLIMEGINRGLTVYTEYGEKIHGSKISAEHLIETI